MKKLLTDTALITFVGLVNRAKGLIFIPIIVRAVGFESYGAFIQIFVTAKLLASVCSLELGMGFQRFVSPLGPDEQEELGRHFFSVSVPALLLGVSGGAAMYALAPFLSDVFLEGRHLDSLRVASFVVLSNVAYSTGRAFMFARRAFARQSFFALGYEFLPYLAFVVAVALEKRLLPGVVAYAVVDFLAAAVLLGYVRRGLTWARPAVDLVKRYLRYSAPLSMSNLQGGLLDKADRFFISGFLGLEAVGIYNVVYRCTELVGYISLPVRTQLLTYLSATWDQGHREESKAILRSTLLSFFLVTVGLLTCLSLWFESFLPILVGEPVIVEHLRWIVFLIGVGVIADGSRRFLYLLIRLNQSTGDELRYQLIGLVVNVAGNLLLVPRFGLLGAALATLVAYLSILPFLLRKYDLRLDLSFLGHLVSFFALALLVVPLRYVLPDRGLGWLLLGGGTTFAVYLALILLVKRRFLASLRESFVRWHRLAF